jgi:iduronate 2-sulfatase
MAQAALTIVGVQSYATTKRDVIMIASDDMRPELGCYGCDYMKTPVMDALASESLVFDHM